VGVPCPESEGCHSPMASPSGEGGGMVGAVVCGGVSLGPCVRGAVCGVGGGCVWGVKGCVGWWVLCGVVW